MIRVCQYSFITLTAGFITLTLLYTLAIMLQQAENLGLDMIAGDPKGMRPTHFTRTVYSDYKGEYPSEKKSNDPLEKVRHKPEAFRQPGVAFKTVGQSFAITGSRNSERYAHFESAGIRRTSAEPVSTFSIDVDTASYANMRRFVRDGELPPADAVRIEEMINYFRYDYPAPAEGDQPFTVSWELMRTPWNRDTALLRLGLRGYAPPAADRPPANLVFLLDVSGSMTSSDKLPLMVKGMKHLTRQLRDDDRVAIVVYAGSSGLVLESTSGRDKRLITTSLDMLRSGGSTAGGAGINLAYSVAQASFVKGGINRVILATDGDFNVGVTDIGALKTIIARKREEGVSLTTLGFGTGDLNDALLEQLADIGNGNYAYIDSLAEARKVLGEEVESTLHTIAKDVKIQIQFNPGQVSEYRLIGYENRILAPEDFANDKVDAGEIGAGHTVTALYEIARTGSAGERLPKPRYEAGDTGQGGPHPDEFAFVKLRYKSPGEDTSLLIELSLPSTALAAASAESGDTPSPDMNFAAAVAAFGQYLRQSPHIHDFGIDDIAALARKGVVDSSGFHRQEFLELLELAKIAD